AASWDLTSGSVLEGTLYACVERIESLQGERLGRGEAPTYTLRAVVGEHAVLQSHTPIGPERRRSVGGDQAQPELHVAQHAPLLGTGQLGPVGVLARLAEIVNERRAQQQPHLGNRHRVLEQAAKEGVVSRGAR